MRIVGVVLLLACLAGCDKSGTIDLSWTVRGAPAAEGCQAGEQVRVSVFDLDLNGLLRTDVVRPCESSPQEIKVDRGSYLVTVALLDAGDRVVDTHDFEIRVEGGRSVDLMVAFVVAQPPPDAGPPDAMPVDAGAPIDATVVDGAAADAAVVDGAPGGPDAGPGVPDAAPGVPDAATPTVDAAGLPLDQVACTCSDGTTGTQCLDLGGCLPANVAAACKAFCAGLGAPAPPTCAPSSCP